MFKAIKEFFTGKPVPVETPAPVAEYKIEAPLVHLGPEPTPVAEQATQAVVESIAPAKKKPVPKKAPAAKKTTAKKPRAPRAPTV
jgi:hypothetical protein